ncbi:MAG: subtilisin family serine protease [Ulvibacter sp.]|jgi:subtilisin family serine protease|tara:strand:- start:5746 stop:6969 length:1224 start_codon:yes stop_codon:yes gene_type:complete
MRKSIIQVSLLSIAFIFVGCQSDSVEETHSETSNISFEMSREIKNSYIVQYNNSSGKIKALTKVKSASEYSTQMRSLKTTFLEEFKSIALTEKNIKATYGHSITGFSAILTEAQVELLKNDPRILSIEEDMSIILAPGNGNGGPGGGGGGTTPPQETSYGTTRVGGGTTTSSNTAWVIDTGIDLDHPDLNVDTTRSISFLTGSPSNQNPDDQNGHGTHVAGTIAAIDNNIGSLGVAPGSNVVAVRVLDRRGSGSNSGVISGVDYVAAYANNGDVANMSLGGGVSSALDNAVIAAAATGVKFVLAAGNESDDANNHSPARANGPNIYTISAMNNSDNWASFSNFGTPVDYCAPGVSIFSTWKSGGYNTISGTSMAAPHAAGVLLLGNPTTDGTVNGDPDGNPDPIIHN